MQKSGRLQQKTPTPERTGSSGQKPVMERTLQQSECKVFYRYGQIKESGTIYLTSSPTPQCRLGCLLICGKCRAAFRRVACCASVLSSHRSTITRLPSGTSPSQLHAIFAPSALCPGMSRRCTWRSVASGRAQRQPSVAQVP